MDERLRFVARRLEGEKMTALCAEFGISRKTGHEIVNRYKDCGVQGLTDRSRRPYRHANQLPEAVEALIVGLKRDYPSWGAPKIRERLRRRWVRTDLLQLPEDQREQSPGRAAGGRPPDRRPPVAGQLHGLRFGLL